MEKRKLIVGLFSLATVGICAMFSCSKDPCDGVYCEHGYCLDGICECDPGWKGTYCDIPEQSYTFDCSNIYCVNGTCVDGVCECDPGWTGEACDVQKTPSKIIIDSIAVKIEYSSYDDGLGDNNPDIYIKLYDGNGLLIYESGYINDMLSGFWYIYIPPYSIETANVAGEWFIELYDYDQLSANDYYGGIRGTIYDSNNGFPSVISWSAANGISVKYYVRYQW